MILSSGEVPLANIINFNKHPIGHSKREAHGSMYNLNVYEGDKLPYKKWQYEYMWQRLNIKTRLYITRDAILHSPQYKHLISNIDNTPVSINSYTNDKSLKHVDELVSWSINGRSQRIVSFCWEAFINDEANERYPISADALLEFAKNKIALKTENIDLKDKADSTVKCITSRPLL